MEHDVVPWSEQTKSREREKELWTCATELFALCLLVIMMPNQIEADFQYMHANTHRISKLIESNTYRWIKQKLKNTQRFMSKMLKKTTHTHIVPKYVMKGYLFTNVTLVLIARQFFWRYVCMFCSGDVVVFTSFVLLWSINCMYILFSRNF